MTNSSRTRIPQSILTATYPVCTLMCISCNDFKKRYTSPAYLNHVPVPREYYIRDSIQVRDTLESYLQQHKGFFESKEYFDGTELIVDTIIYNNAFEKFIVFLIAKNPTTRQLYPDKSSDWYYNATSFIGRRDSMHIKLKWIGPNFSNSTNRLELREILRYAYFEEFARESPVENNMYRYNMNDVRFWDSGIWQELKVVRE